MAKFNIFISIVILVAALFLLFNKLFTPQPIQITLQSGQEITTSTSEYFSLTEVLILIISAFLVGTAATYLYYNSERQAKEPKKESSASNYDIILPLLKKEEKSAVLALKEANGEMLQNKLVTKLNLSKVKITRILYGLERKGLISKERYGLTNMVKLKK